MQWFSHLFNKNKKQRSEKKVKTLKTLMYKNDEIKMEIKPKKKGE